MIQEFKIVKERCEGCQKFILMHNKIMSCHSCKRITHAECAISRFEYNNLSDSWQCWECISNTPARYNPFSTLSYDKHDPNNMDKIDDIIEISKILDESCSYNTANSNKLSKSVNNENSLVFSALFNNIDGNSANFDKFACEVSQYRNIFSVIAIAETNIDQCHKDLYRLNNYNSEYNNKITGKKKGSGLGIYVHDDLIYSRIDKLCNCTDNLESLFIKITNTDTSITVGAVYRPPSGVISKFIEEIDALMAMAPDKDVIIMGDFNMDLFRPNNEYESTIYGNNFIPTIALATHEKPGCTSTLIDNILLNSTGNLITAGVLENKVSHHSPVFCYLNSSLPQRSIKVDKLPKFDYCETNVCKFLEEVKETITDNEICYTNEGFKSFVDSMINKIDETFRVDEEVFKKSRRNFLVNPWITSGIIASVSKKNYYYKQWKKTVKKHNKGGNTDLYMRFKNFRRKLKYIIMCAKRNFYHRKFENVQGNIKKTWELINELRGKSKPNMKASFVINGKLVENRRDISNNFNIFFSSIAKKMNVKLYSSTLNNENENYSKYLSNRVTGSIFLSLCSSEEIEEIINKLENDKASDISIVILKRCAGLISRHLANFLNYFMDCGVFPSILKTGKITPIFKKGDPQLLDNYRPISMLPVFGKIFEKLIYKRLYSFLTSMNVIYDKQFGFRKSHSTSHAVNYSINKILGEIEDGNHVIGVFIDLSKAFDTIDHRKLLNKLEHYGVRGVCHNLLSSYLSDRTQYTDFQRTYSDLCTIEYGVPQGSVLGPLLFIIYINDIINSSVNGNFVLFADDTNIFVVGKTIKEAYENTNSVLNEVHHYMRANKLHINLSKCSYMHFRPQHSNTERLTCARTREYGTEPVIKLCNKKLKKVDRVKFLGVIIDDKLNWDAQIDHLVTKLNSSIVVIKRIKKFIPESEYMKLYNALFKSHMTYCISCWGGISSNKLQKIFYIQKRCIRLLFGKEFSFDHAGFTKPVRECVRMKRIWPQKYFVRNTQNQFSTNVIS